MKIQLQECTRQGLQRKLLLTSCASVMPNHTGAEYGLGVFFKVDIGTHSLSARAHWFRVQGLGFRITPGPKSGTLDNNHSNPAFKPEHAHSKVFSMPTVTIAKLVKRQMTKPGTSRTPNPVLEAVICTMRDPCFITVTHPTQTDLKAHRT